MNALKSVMALALAAVFGAVALGSDAEAGCVSCRVRADSTSVRTVNKTRVVRQVRDVTRVQHVSRHRVERKITRVVTKTVVVPVTRVNTITRVHHHTTIVKARQHVDGGTVYARGRVVAGWSATQHVHHRANVVRGCAC